MNDLTPPALPLSELQSALRASHGLIGEWRPMSGERDLNHQVMTADGTSYVFKVCNPHEGKAIIDCHVAALKHIAAVDPGLAVPRLYRTLSAAALGEISHDGQTYETMLLSYLPGDVIGSTELVPELYFEAGRQVARLGVAMRGFVHPGPASRRFVWDTQHACDLAGQIPYLPLADRPVAEVILDRHRSATVPELAKLRTQIIHGDVHPYNMLIDATGNISGIIDFGDIVHAPLVQDVSNALADFIFPGHDIARTLLHFIRGYASVTPLEEAEADVVLDLIEVRLLMTALIFSLKDTAGAGTSGYLDDFTARVMPLIGELRGTQRQHLQDLIRRAAAYPPKHDAVPPAVDEIIARRRRVMGEKLYVFYDPPLHIVKGDGVWLTASDGRRYLDCYNNVPHVGHCHPYVTEAIARQARILNTNTRYLTDQSITYAERLAELSSDGLSAVVFVNSGSEANDLAWRMAKAWTGKRGGLAMEFAYHGVSEAIDAFSPSNSVEHWHAPHIRLLPAPDTYRGPFGVDEPQPGERYAALADPLISELEGRGFGLAAAMIDSAFMTNGILDAPRGYLQGIADRVHKSGGLFIADEVQSGFGRMGTQFWGHRHHGVTPDFITIGKPAGNGHPLGAVVTRPEILNRFLEAGPFFSTFGGNNVACAAGLAVLDVIRDEGLLGNALETGNYFRQQLTGLKAKHAVIGDVRGVGLATGLELVHDRTTKLPAGDIVPRLLGLLRDQGVLMGGEGKHGNVLKIRPPIVFGRQHADIAVAAMDRALSRL